MSKRFYRSGGNVFEDMGFSPAEAATLTAKSDLIAAIRETIDARKLTQTQAAAECGIDQPTISKVLRGRMESVTIDRLSMWLSCLGGTVKISAHPYRARTASG